MSRAKSLLFLLFIPFFCLSAAAEEKITDKNWYNHPEITAIRDLVADIKTQAEKGVLVKQEKVFGYCRPYEDTTRRMHVDGQKVVREYYYEAGSDDSRIGADFYYDGTGKIRFAFIQGGAVNGTSIEHRIYFNAQGKRIWEFQKKLEGPGYTFPADSWPDEQIVFDPVKSYEAKNDCQ